MEHKGDGDANYNWGTWNNLQSIGKGIGRYGNKRISGVHLDFGIIKKTT